jgi:nucleotide-binding universal stress UspA family protein
MPANKRILIGVDQSDASRHAVHYVAEMVGAKPGIHVGLIHLELPPRMLEWGGSEDPDVEDKVSIERADAYEQMERKAVEDGHALLKKLQAILVEKRIDVAGRLVQFEEPLDPESIADHLLKTAKEQDYGTIVVGRHSFSDLRRMFQHHVGMEILRRGDNLAVWVVE